jgi:hypothetical protein
VPKNREMKEEPTILLKTKDRLSEPTMSMKIKVLSSIGHDLFENKILRKGRRSQQSLSDILYSPTRQRARYSWTSKTQSYRTKPECS